MYDLEVLAMLAAGLLLTGAIAGLLAGLLGVGGGIVIVPVLFWLFAVLNVSPAVAMHMAVGTSLCSIIPTSISSARSHQKRGAIDIDLLKGWAPVIFVGALVGGILSKFLDAQALTLVFGVIALAVALNMAMPKTLVVSQTLPSGVVGAGAVPFSIGGFSALMGIGGGTLSVPVLSAFSVPVHRAVGTASAFGLAISVPATIGFLWSGLGIADRPPWSLGYVSVPAAILIFSMSVLTAPYGSKLAHSLNPLWLKRAFALFLFLTAIKMLSTVSFGGGALS